MHPARAVSLVLWVTGYGADGPETRGVRGIGPRNGIDFALPLACSIPLHNSVRGIVSEIWQLSAITVNSEGSKMAETQKHKESFIFAVRIGNFLHLYERNKIL
jgi:hypothetical protein